MAAASSVESTSDVPEEWEKWNQHANELVTHFEMMGGGDNSIMGHWAESLACLIASKPKCFQVEREEEENGWTVEMSEAYWFLRDSLFNEELTEYCKFTKQEGTNIITKAWQYGSSFASFRQLIKENSPSSTSSKKENSCSLKQKLLSEYLTCPITMELIVDPVAMPCCGALFSQKSIFQAFEHNSLCPHCRAQFRNYPRLPIIPNIKSIIGICKENEETKVRAASTQSKKIKREMHCSKCGEVGHTKRTCVKNLGLIPSASH